MTRRRKECCCCAGDAGVWEQHWNRDRGYGICWRCVQDEIRRDPDSVRSLYGVQGVNWGPPE